MGRFNETTRIRASSARTRLRVRIRVFVCAFVFHVLYKWTANFPSMPLVRLGCAAAFSFFLSCCAVCVGGWGMSVYTPWLLARGNGLPCHDRVAQTQNPHCMYASQRCCLLRFPASDPAPLA